MSDIDLLSSVRKKRAARAAVTAAPATGADKPQATTSPPGRRRGSTLPPLDDLALSTAENAPSATDAAHQDDAGEPGQTAGPVPSLEDRPCWRVFDDWTDPGNGAPKLKPGVWRFGIKTKGEKMPELTQTYVCGPLRVTAVTTNAADGNFGRLLHFKTTLEKWREWAMPMTLLAGDGIELRAELLYQGLEVDPVARGLLAQYIQDKTPRSRIRCVEQTGWAGGGLAAFVLPDEVVGPDAAKVVYQTGHAASDEYTTGGTLAAWRAGIASKAVGNPLLMLSLCAAFAGPVLARCNAESGGIHLVGDSSTGKSTAIEAARSVWGGPGFKRSWRTTGNGLEGAAALFNDCLLALDEISECDPREVGAIVYSLGNGRGKQRAGRTGAARHVKTWRCSVLSSGEFTIGTTMTEGGHRIKAGQSMRLLDVPAKREFGAWDALHGSDSGNAMTDSLKRESNLNFGHAGRAFLQRLAYDEADLTKLLDAIKALPEFTADGADGQVSRSAARFALLALAGELATDYGVTGWPQGEAIKAAAVGFESWRILRGDHRATHEHRQILDRLAEFLERHGDSRFSDKDTPLAPERAALIRDRAGWFDEAMGNRRYLFTASGLKEALRGFDFERAKAVLHTAGALLGTVARQTRFADGGNHRVYTVNPEALYPADSGKP
jgi:putative DNA primase/helicase